MNTRNLLFMLLYLLGLKPLAAVGQSLPVSSPVLEDYLRRQQLIGTLDASYSFMLRPIFPINAFGANDGAMIPNAGLQLLLSGGIYYEYGKWTVQFQPEILIAQNKDYQGFPLEHDGSTWIEYYEWLNFSDIPERFGTKSYTRLL